MVIRRIAAVYLFLGCFFICSAQYLSCSELDKSAVCSSTEKKVCAIKTVGLPITYKDSCEACVHNDTTAYFEGQCENSLGTCGPRHPGFHCMVIARAMVPTCGFEEGKEPVDVSNDFCCTEDSYTRFRQGKCPKVTKNDATTKLVDDKNVMQKPVEIEQPPTALRFVILTPDKRWYVEDKKHRKVKREVCVTFRNGTRLTTFAGDRCARGKQVKKLTLGQCK